MFGESFTLPLTQTEEEKEKIKAEKERVEKEAQALTTKCEVLTIQLQRTEQKREVRHEAPTTKSIDVE